MKAPGIEDFSKRLDEIFEQGMPAKAQILDAFNKSPSKAAMPSDWEKESSLTLKSLMTHKKETIAKWYLDFVNKDVKYFLQRYEIFKSVNGLNDSGKTHEEIMDEYLTSK